MGCPWGYSMVENNFKKIYEVTSIKIKINKQTLNRLRFTNYQKKLLSIIVFFTSYTFLLLFMHNFLHSTCLNFIPFWLAILGIIVPVIYQIYRTKLNSSIKLIIFIEIALIILFFNLIQIMLRLNLLVLSGDAYRMLISANHIKTTNNILTTSKYDFDLWPCLQLISIAISDTSGINLYNIAVFSPIFYQFLELLFIYLLAKELYNDQSALLACLTFAPFHLLWKINSQFRPEIMASVFVFAYLFVLVKRSKKVSQPLFFSLLAILFTISIVMTHYTTNGFFVLLLVITFLSFTFSNFLKSKKQNLQGFLFDMPLVFVIFAFITCFAYWIYVGKPLFTGLIKSIVEEVYAPTIPLGQFVSLPPRPPLLKEKVILRSNQVYIFLFIVLMVYELLKRRDCKSWQADFWLSSWAGVTFFIWLIISAPVGLKPGLGILPMPGYRVYLFSYPFVLIVVAHIINNLKSSTLKKVFVSLLISFVLLNVLTIDIIPLNPLSSSSPVPLSSWDTTPEVQAAKWISPTDRPIVSPIGTLIRYIHGIETSVCNRINLFYNDLRGLKTCAWLHFTPHNPTFRYYSGEGKHVDVRLDNETIFKILNTFWLQKVYTNRENEIYYINS